MDKVILDMRNKSLVDIMVDKITDEFKRLLENDDRVQEFVNKFGKEYFIVTVKVLKMSEYIKQTMEVEKFPISKNEFDRMFREFTNIESSTFTMRTGFDFKDGREYVKECQLVIKKPALEDDICDYIANLPLLMNMYEILLRHEWGHFVDHIINDHGRLRSEFDEKVNTVKNDYSKYYEWCEEYRKKPGCKMETAIKAYYNIPSEARANEYGGVDIDEYIKYRKELNDNIRGNIITIENGGVSNDQIIDTKIE